MHPPSPLLLRALRHTISRPFASSQSVLTHPSSRSLHSTPPLSRTSHPALTNSPSATRPSAPRSSINPHAPTSRDRGPKSKEDTQTDFGAMNVLANTPPPATAIDACLHDGFHLSNGVKITEGAGVLLVGGEVWGWRPWEAAASNASAAGSSGARAPDSRDGMLNAKGQFEVGKDAWGLLDLVWPKPELLIVGMGKGLYPLSRETREAINGLGIRVDILDTRNAAAQFNLLATERGVGVVAAAMVPVGWKGRF